MKLPRRLALLGALSLLAGCALLKTISAEVRSFGNWPEGRAAGSYAFERLPSQQQPLSRAAEWEALAAPALAKAGFKPVAPGAQPDVIVALGVRVSATATSPWDDPLWSRWNAPLYHWRFGLPPHRHPLFIERSYEREVGVLLRDRTSGQPLFEARASSEGATPGGDELIGGLFEAALRDFPKAQPQPHRVQVLLP
ncbi:hypothetical protein HNQ51_000534 [Inhella inkyongensis]|uniref:DUF4136 domain-containing protein n=1 Tax=Inhella inkyongensis TaxID=392593 RepID=A0A840S3K1_9BURK|nr:DUF4136 domain-containing protein [Inhella inkyongensis]MBB5203241.1 hypothetical protein [Inhella inkyongensis]